MSERSPRSSSVVARPASRPAAGRLAGRVVLLPVVLLVRAAIWLLEGFADLFVLLARFAWRHSTPVGGVLTLGALVLFLADTLVWHTNNPALLMIATVLGLIGLFLFLPIFS